MNNVIKLNVNTSEYFRLNKEYAISRRFSVKKCYARKIKERDVILILLQDF